MGFRFFDYLKREPDELNFRILIVTGFWPLDTKKKWLIILHSIFSFLCSFSLISMMFIQILDLYELRNDPITMVKNLSASGMTFMCVTKYLYFIIKAKEIKKLSADIKSFRQSRRDAEDIELFHKSDKEILKATKTFYGIAIPCVISWMTYPVLDTTEYRRIPFPYRLPVDHKKTPIYEILYVYQCFSMIGFLTNIVSLDLNFFGLVLQIKTLYNVLIKNFRNFKDATVFSLYENSNKNMLDKKAEEMIKKNCRLQIQIYEKIRQLENIFSVPGLLTYMSVVNQIGTIVIDILLFNHGFGIKLMQRLLYVMCGLFDTFLWSYCGTILVEKSFETANAAYDIPWYEMSSRVRKKILLILMNSARPPVISLALIFPLGLQSFLKIIQLSYNMTALLRETIKK